jgi:hypothetical protein
MAQKKETTMRSTSEMAAEQRGDLCPRCYTQKRRKEVYPGGLCALCVRETS